MTDISETGVFEFDWDEGNIEKNWLKHKVATNECEDVFYNEPLLPAFDKEHSQKENRYSALGVTNTGRKLHIIFTIRKQNIRIISARDMNKKERSKYEKV